MTTTNIDEINKIDEIDEINKLIREHLGRGVSFKCVDSLQCAIEAAEKVSPDGTWSVDRERDGKYHAFVPDTENPDGYCGSTPAGALARAVAEEIKRQYREKQEQGRRLGIPERIDDLGEKRQKKLINPTESTLEDIYPEEAKALRENPGAAVRVTGETAQQRWERLKKEYAPRADQVTPEELEMLDYAMHAAMREMLMEDGFKPVSTIAPEDPPPKPTPGKSKYVGWWYKTEVEILCDCGGPPGHVPNGPYCRRDP